LTGLERLYALDQDQETEYLATLRAYFDAMGDVSAAASALHIHQNTFRYRMRRLGDLSGIRLADPVERFVVELHLRSGLYGLADSDVVRSYN
jgi:DNA-binding PucR family transcriptional regulator